MTVDTERGAADPSHDSGQAAAAWLKRWAEIIYAVESVGRGGNELALSTSMAKHMLAVIEAAANDPDAGSELRDALAALFNYVEGQ